MFQKILVAMDCSAMGKPVFDRALSLGESMGASFKQLHVLFVGEEADLELLAPSIWGYGSAPDEPAFDIHHKQLKAFEMKGLELLRSHTEEARAADVRVESAQILGSPGRTICDTAQTWGADLIVIGSRGLYGPSELQLGNVSNYVTRHAPCSVLIVHSQAEDEAELSAAGKAIVAY